MAGALACGHPADECRSRPSSARRSTATWPSTGRCNPRWSAASDDRVPGRPPVPPGRRGHAAARGAGRSAPLLRGARVRRPAPRQGLARRGGRTARREHPDWGDRILAVRGGAPPSTDGSTTPWNAVRSSSASRDRPYRRFRTRRRRVRRRCSAPRPWTLVQSPTPLSAPPRFLPDPCSSSTAGPATSARLRPRGAGDTWCRSTTIRGAATGRAGTPAQRFRRPSALCAASMRCRWHSGKLRTRDRRSAVRSRGRRRSIRTTRSTRSTAATTASTACGPVCPLASRLLRRGGVLATPGARADARRRWSGRSRVESTPISTRRRGGRVAARAPSSSSSRN